MGFIIGLLTVFMVLDCVVLVFLVLIQLPKKDAGAGLAFGGSATDALFGAGSGNVLTKITKYSATIFFAMAVLLSILQSRFHTRSVSGFQQKLEQGRPPATAVLPPPSASPTTSNAAVPGSIPLTSTNMLSAPAPEATNLPAPPAAPAAQTPTPVPQTPK
jgi:preprotein translocase subunit SecG